MPYDIVIGRDKEDKKKFGDRGLIYVGKGYVKMGNYTSLSNKLWMDVVRSHVILIAGKRGSGKSYSIGVIAEEMSKLPDEVKENIAPLIFDTMGIFWTMKFKNDKELQILELEMINPVSILLQKVMTRLSGFYDLDMIIIEIEKDNESESLIKKSAISLFEAAKSWRVFSEKGEEPTKITDLIVAGRTSVLDLSMYSSISSFNVRALIIGLICKKLFTQRILSRKKEEIESIYYGVEQREEKKETPLVWLFLDEAHEFLPMHGQTPATNALVQLLREGRQPGISMVLATQQPGVIHRDVMTQS